MKQETLNYPFFVIIGPSGSGKTRVTEAVFPRSYKVISHTTRAIRKTEEDGEDYYFETQKTFQLLIKKQAFVEYDCYNGQLYGVTVNELIKKKHDHFAYAVLTYAGFKTIREKFGEQIIPIFFSVSKANVKKRLEERESNKEKNSERLSLFDNEKNNEKNVTQFKNGLVIDANQSFESVVKNVKKEINRILIKKKGLCKILRGNNY